MGSMGRMKKPRLEMFRINSSCDDKIVDHTQYVGDDNNKNLNEECSVDEFSSVKDDLTEACRPFSSPAVPTRPRTPRVEVGRHTYNFEEGVYYWCSTEMIVDEKNSGESMKRVGDEDFIVSDDDYEEFIVSDDDYEEEESQHYEDYIVSDADNEEEEEESSNKKRQKNVEKKTRVPRKQKAVYNLPCELPQNLQDYISGLNLEARPLFVAQKLLTVTDVVSHQSRLLLPESLINAEFLDNFLTEDEKELLKKKKPVQVNLVDDKLREIYGLRMTKWEMNSSSEYALRKVWNKVKEGYNLEPLRVSKDNNNSTIVLMKDIDDKWKTDVVVLIWCFRRESKLWLALGTQAMTDELTILGVTKDKDGGKRYIIK